MRIALGALGFLVFSALLSSIPVLPIPVADAQQPWTDVECGSTPLAVPFTQKSTCQKSPQAIGPGGACNVSAYNARGSDDALQYLVFFTSRGGIARGACAFDPPDDLSAAIKSATPMSNRGSDFSAVKRIGAGGAMTFTAKGPKGPMKCFAFVKFDRKVTGKGSQGYDKYDHQLRGHVCRTGAAIGDDEMTQLISGISSK